MEPVISQPGHSMKSENKPVKTKVNQTKSYWYQWKGYSILFQNFHKGFPLAARISQNDAQCEEQYLKKMSLFLLCFP